MKNKKIIMLIMVFLISIDSVSAMEVVDCGGLGSVPYVILRFIGRVINIIKVIAVIIGTIIGAGFASGKEIYIFFAKYEKGGFLGAIISATLTAIIIYKTIAIVKKYNIENNNEFVEKIAHNQKIALILKNIINIFLV